MLYSSYQQSIGPALPSGGICPIACDRGKLGIDYMFCSMNRRKTMG